MFGNGCEVCVRYFRIVSVFVRYLCALMMCVSMLGICGRGVC